MNPYNDCAGAIQPTPLPPPPPCGAGIAQQLLPPPVPTRIPALGVTLANGQSLDDQLLALNAVSIAGAPDCSSVVVRGGKLVPVSMATALACLPWDAPGETIVWDGAAIKLQVPPKPIQCLRDLIDGPGVITPGGILQGSAGGNGWAMVPGLVVPVPSASGMALISQQNGSALWMQPTQAAIASGFIKNCLDLRAKIRSCVPDACCAPDRAPCAPARVLGVDDCNNVGFYLAKDLASASTFGCADAQKCFTPDPLNGSPAMVYGQSADGKMHEFPLSTVQSGSVAGANGITCAGLKSIAPDQALSSRPSKVVGAASDGSCGSFVRGHDMFFRAEVVLAPTTKTQAVSAWAGASANWLFSQMSQVENSGSAAGVWDQANSTYTLAEAGLYEVSGSGYFLVQFAGSGTGAIQADTAYTLTAGIIAAGRDWYMQQYALLIAKNYDPAAAFSINGASNAFVSPGVGYFWSTSRTARFNAGDKIKAVSYRMGQVRGSTDPVVTITSKYNGTGDLTIRLLPEGGYF